MGFSSGMMPPLQPKWKFYPMRILLIAFAITCISACTAVGFPGVYRIDVEQGNIVTQELADQLQPGMSRRQVRFILGTPMVEDSFNRDRWDYIYTRRNGLEVLAEDRLTVFFEADSLTSVIGDYIPEAFGGPSPAESGTEPLEETIEEETAEEDTTEEETAEKEEAAEQETIEEEETAEGG